MGIPTICKNCKYEFAVSWGDTAARCPQCESGQLIEMRRCSKCNCLMDLLEDTWICRGCKNQEPKDDEPKDDEAH